LFKKTCHQRKIDKLHNTEYGNVNSVHAGTKERLSHGSSVGKGNLLQIRWPVLGRP